MRKKIKALIAIICAAMLFGSCSGISGRQSSGNGNLLGGKSVALVGDIPCKFPLVTDGTSLNILSCTSNDIKAEDIYVWKKYSEMTGVSVNWTTVNKDSRGEEVTAVLSNKAALDIIMRCKISSSRLTQYGESGLILDLAKDDLLKNNAPNCWAYLQSHPDSLAAVTNPDGTIYSLPQVNSGAELRVSRKIFINKKWLENVNMNLPTTTEEFYTLLKAFKEQDANGNGDKNDEIPFCPADWASVQDCLFGAFGLGNRGCHNMFADCDESTGKVRLIASSDNYKAFLEYLNRLYSEQLIDNYLFTITSDQWNNNIQNDRIGVFASTNLAALTTEEAENWVAVGEALEGPNGDKLWAAVRANFQGVGAAVIPATCDNPELALQWLDYFWTDEGTLFYHMGIENETYIINEDGTYDYAPEIYERIKNENKTFDRIVSEYSPYVGGSNPTVEIAPYFMGGEMADVPAEAARSLFKYGPKECWPSFTFTADENERLRAVQSDIDKYCDTSRVEFITGAKPFSDWHEYTSQLERLGAKDAVAVYQAAADRYHALSENSTGK